MPHRDWSGQWIKPLVYRNGNQWHFNFLKAGELLIFPLLTAFLIFMGNRYIVFEKNTLASEQLAKDITVIKALSYKVDTSMRELTDIVFGHIEVETRRDKDRVSQQIEMYKLNRAQRQKDLEKLRQDLNKPKE